VPEDPSFVSKLAGATKQPASEREVAEEPAIDAIARNLEAVLNAKQGYSGMVEVFGLGRYDAHHADKALLGALSDEMIEQVRRYEPRLREPKLTLVGKDRGLWVRFSLSGRYGEETRRFAVLFHSVFRNVRVAHEKQR
jgi:predicted component of type VI protein secretion system